MNEKAGRRPSVNGVASVQPLTEEEVSQLRDSRRRGLFLPRETHMPIIDALLATLDAARADTLASAEPSPEAPRAELPLREGHATVTLPSGEQYYDPPVEAPRTDAELREALERHFPVRSPGGVTTCRCGELKPTITGWPDHLIAALAVGPSSEPRGGAEGLRERIWTYIVTRHRDHPAWDRAPERCPACVDLTDMYADLTEHPSQPAHEYDHEETRDGYGNVVCCEGHDAEAAARAAPSDRDVVSEERP